MAILSSYVKLPNGSVKQPFHQLFRLFSPGPYITKRAEPGKPVSLGCQGWKDGDHWGKMIANPSIFWDFYPLVI